MSGVSFLSNQSREDEIIYALAQELQNTDQETIETPTVEVEVSNALASVVETLNKCAEKLEAVGHPSLEHVDNVLSFIDKEFFTAEPQQE